MPQVSERKIGLRMTREGSLVLCIVVLMLILGIFKNINLLTLLGFVLLTLFALSGWFAGRRLSRLEGRRVLMDSLFAGQSLHLETRVKNESSRSLPGVRIEDVGSDHEVGWYLSSFPGKSRHHLFADVVLPRRGWYDCLPLTASSTHPFGLWQRRVRIGEADRVLVFPAIGRLSRDRLRRYLHGSDPRGEPVRRPSWRHETAQADFHGLRPFRTGDSPRWIHWRTSARRGELMVREFEDLPGDDLALIMDPSFSGEFGQDFDALVSLAATIVHEWCSRTGDRFAYLECGGEPEVAVGATGAELERKVLTRLAQIAPIREGSVPVDVLLSHVPSTAAVLLVAARDTGLRAMAEAALHRPVALLSPKDLQRQGVYAPP
ncbi:MAG: DUF58 domain-containing protein [Gemmataceae bacterium]